MVIGIEIGQFVQDTPHNEIADAVGLTAHKHRAKIVVDMSNAFAYQSYRTRSLCN